jgi:alkylhydroperoxidase family enzyme
MPRIKLVEPADASAEVKEIYDTELRGKPGNVHKALANRPEVLKTFIAFYGSVGRSLNRRLYELVYIRVSMLNQCEY